MVGNDIPMFITNPSSHITAGGAEGKTDAVKAALEAYVQSEQQSMEHYLEDQYLVAKAATVTVAPTGEVVLVCAEDHDTILSNIEKALAA